jgi:hypothetical protein
MTRRSGSAPMPPETRRNGGVNRRSIGMGPASASQKNRPRRRVTMSPNYMGEKCRLEWREPDGRLLFSGR